MTSAGVPFLAVPQHFLGTQDFWSDFVTSPGFGGLAALVAALIGYRTVLHRARVDSRIAAADRQDQNARAHDDRTARERTAERERQDAADALRASHWWDMYRWALEQLDSLDAERVLGLLAALDEQAPSEAERALVSVAIDLFITAEEGGADAHLAGA